ncbi:MAG: tRNA (adenosine(37)-N6)-threonylcarbamoyltransferase complex dimerization subunit type 1 TsaB [Syntrophales bacterium]|nr:tRNA (adenosine(37)-N6)-threonylcarbamoyltransferase complex dimerization subunit type 1 TsaB [Syntrophales bacterium]
MLTLAVDTSTQSGSVALLNSDSVLAECLINVGINHSETLLPAIERILSVAGTEIAEVDLFALTVGPGSFTGLRVGVSTVKGLALAADKPVVGVSSIDALALNVANSTITICPMLDARKKEVYTALYRSRRRGMPEKIVGEMIVDPETFLKGIDEEVIFLGDGAINYCGLIKEILPDKSYFALSHLQYIKASTVGLLGMNKFIEGDVLDIMTFIPQYLRLSEAEMKRVAGK